MKPDHHAEVVQLGVAAANKGLEYVLEVLNLKPGQPVAPEKEQELFTVLISLLAHQLTLTALQFDHQIDIKKLGAVVTYTAVEWLKLYKDTLAEDEQKGQDHAVVP